MTHTRIYTGSFLGADGTHWQVDIERDGATPGADGGELIFPADTPVELEWTSTAKTDALCPSALTLRVESTTDRRFTSLYSTRPGEVRLRLLRNGELYWCGLLDTELYEEPYAYASGYDVQITFSDLGQLKRFRWTGGAGTHTTLRAMVATCVAPLLRDGEVDVQYATGTTAIAPDGTDAGSVLDALLLDTSNFTSEQAAGEDVDDADTLSDVLEAVLQPFGLRVEQRAGAFHVYDLHTLYSAHEPQAVHWEGTDATLGVDKVYNNVRVTFSPNADTTLLDGTIAHDDAEFETEEGSKGIMVAAPDRHDINLPGFNISWGTPRRLPQGMELHNGARMFRIDAAYDGSDCAGAVWAFSPTGTKMYVNDHFTGTPWPIITLGRKFLPACEIGDMLRVSLDLMFSPAYNPFESPDSEESLRKWFDKWLNIMCVPFQLRLWDSDKGGFCLYHYENYKFMGSGMVSRSGGTWEPGDYSAYPSPPGMGAFMAWYDWTERSKKCGVLGGWQTNRPLIGNGASEKMPDGYQRRGNGEFMPVPPCAGYIELTIFSSFTYCNADHIGSYDWDSEIIEGSRLMRWLMYKDPYVELCNASGKVYGSEATDAVEYSAWLLPDAEERLDIDTAVGSSADLTLPGARGVALLRGSLTPLRLCERAGVRDSPEHLLIGTVYSQHATRHTTLRGTAAIAPAFGTFADAAMPGTVFARMGCVERPREAEADVTLVELSPESYEGITYEQ